MTRLILRLTVASLLVALSGAANASPFKTPSYKVQCKTPFCGKVSNAPKATLLRVNPSPLPRVDRGDSQQVTVQWRMRFGLRANYSLCVTSSRNAAPVTNDPCQSLPASNLINSTSTSETYEDTVTLAANFYRPQAKFYVRTTARLHLGSSPNWTPSNEVVFTWPLTQTNLFSHKAAMDFSDGMVRITHRISNESTTDADASVTDFVISFCHASQQLPASNPEVSGSEGLCHAGLEGHIANAIMSLATNVPPLVADTIEFQYTTRDFSSELPVLPSPYWVSITARVDANQDLDESNEQDNNRLGTYHLW